jgi:hypothetical protein
MKRFLLTHNATVGRTTADGAVFPPVRLIFYSIVEAADTEAASAQAVQYSDPSFVTRVADITELGEGLTAEELFGLLDHKKILVEDKV